MALSRWRMCGRVPNIRQLLILSCCLFLFWCLTLYRMSNFSYQKQKESEVLKNEIIQLSEKYVRALSRENSDVVDGPYAGRFTAYDLKKTMAVLLESMLERINRLENQVNLVKNGSNSSMYNNSMPHGRGEPPLRAEDDSQQWNFPNPWAIQARNAEKAVEKKPKEPADLIQGRLENCDLTDEDKQLFPHCQGKIEWMRQMWQSDACYASYGVDGSDCSFVMYLSEVEGWCPKKAWRGNIRPPTEDKSLIKYANTTVDLERLMKIMVDPNERQSYAWIRMRIRTMWPKWSAAIMKLRAKQDFGDRRRKKILVHLGLLSRQSGWKFAENQFKGGPLGELVQWSDLICTLYMLGHDLTITSESEQLGSILARLPAANSPCQSRKELPVQIIYTDIVGLRQFKRHVKGGYGKFSCLLRIVDSFGTEPAYNLRVYAKSHKILTSWGGQDLLPQQFFTMFPHSPDNSFMGFVVDQYFNESSSKHIKKSDWALVYGKNEYMWQHKNDYLEVIKRKLEIHGTVYVDNKNKTHEEKKPDKNAKPPPPKFVIPQYVHNHGLLPAEDFHVLLRKSKIFVGLGFPYEGPAPLEAIANGAVYINPSFNPPHSSRNTKFFKGKPTAREITSQHPYVEQFIGEPFVYTIDINQLDLVAETVDRILSKNVFDAHMPYEFTEEGMLQRMNAYIEHQNYCQFQKKLAKWPPRSAIKFIMGEQGLSCKDVCWSENLICEPSHFLEINSGESLMKHKVECAREDYISDIFYPAYDPSSKECFLQKEELLFSCVGEKNNLRRLCPCRNYIKGQTALCQGCER